MSIFKNKISESFTLKSIVLTLGIQLCVVGVLFAQDIHYTQFYNAPFQVSPSQIGLFDGYLRVQGNFRNQWASVPVGYKTTTLAVDKKFYSKKENQFFAGGLVFNYDQAGFSKLNHSQVQVLGSFTRRTSKKTYATVGSILSFNHRAFRLGDLTFDNQYDGQGGVDPSVNSGEAFPNLSNNFGNLAVGFNFRYQSKDTFALVDRLEKRTKFDVGVGFYNLTRPNQSFVENTNVPLPIRISPYIFGTLKLTDEWDAVGSFLVQFQSTYLELNYGAAFKFHVNRQPGKQLAIQAGMNFRSHDFGESWSPTAEVHYNNWRVGFSYEVNTSAFQIATDRNSGPELSVRYLFKRVQNLPQRICPII